MARGTRLRHEQAASNEAPLCHHQTGVCECIGSGRLVTLLRGAFLVSGLLRLQMRPGIHLYRSLAWGRPSMLVDANYSWAFILVIIRGMGLSRTEKSTSLSWVSQFFSSANNSSEVRKCSSEGDRSFEATPWLPATFCFDSLESRVARRAPDRAESLSQ
jgi:hypothetical protein